MPLQLSFRHMHKSMDSIIKIDVIVDINANADGLELLQSCTKLSTYI